MCCRNLLPPADFRTRKRRASRRMIFSRPLPQRKRNAAVVSSYSLRAGEMARISPAEVRTRYGVDPAQVPDFIALRGDPSDKVPGAPGVGATGAATLLQRYGCLEAALEAGRFPAMAERLRLFRSLATMNRKAPLPNLRSQKPTWHKAAALAREWELNQLAHRLEELGAQG